MKTVVVDPRVSGISGDMFLAALLDLGAKPDKLYELANVIGDVIKEYKGLRVEILDVRRSGIRAKKVNVIIKEGVHEMLVSNVRKYFMKICDDIGLSAEARSYALKVLNELIEAECKVHGVSEEVAHFHELASADTYFDIIGAAILLDDLKILGSDFEIYTTPPALGGGTIRIEHGVVPVPAPATLEIIRKHKYSFSHTPVKMELTTPTGIALLVNLTESVVDFYPPIKVENVGYGAGTKDIKGVPNVLRIVMGYSQKVICDKIMVLETNIDDATGEVLGYLINKLIKEGALDVSIIPAIGKKSRPMHIVKVLSSLRDYPKLVDLLMDESGTLGVRLLEVPRIVAERERKPIKVTVKGKEFYVRVKTSRTAYGKIINVKPEYDDLKRIAEELEMPLRKVMRIVEEELRNSYGELLKN